MNVQYILVGPPLHVFYYHSDAETKNLQNIVSDDTQEEEQPSIFLLPASAKSMLRVRARRGLREMIKSLWGETQEEGSEQSERRNEERLVNYCSSCVCTPTK